MAKKNTNKGILWGSLAAIGVSACIGGLALVSCGTDSFDRSMLDAYLASENGVKQFEPGVSVYFDFSNGMNHAYASADAQAILKNVVNKVLGPNANAEYFSLASNEITPLKMSQTELYNAVVNPGNYTQEEAPIEKTLNEIVKNRKQALLVTDYEEYNNGRIQQAAYAKTAFIDWLKMGYSITFYKWDFTENGKAKHLYLTVFDYGEGGLGSEMETAIAQSGASSSVQKYVLGGREFPYLMMCQYPGATKGGMYHDENGVDIISGTIENGDNLSFFNYAEPKADAKGDASKWLPAGTLGGMTAQFYPITVSWTDVISNVKALSDEGVPEEQRYQHYLSHFYVNFTNQDSYSISRVEARCFNVEQAVTDTTGTAPASVEVHDMFEANMLPLKENVDGRSGWQELVVDFSPKFTGELAEKYGKPTDMLRINLVISKATPELGDIETFFGWTGNSSLSQSVLNTITSPEVNPEGRVLMSYFIKKI